MIDQAIARAFAFPNIAVSHSHLEYRIARSGHLIADDLTGSKLINQRLNIRTDVTVLLGQRSQVTLELRCILDPHRFGWLTRHQCPPTVQTPALSHLPALLCTHCLHCCSMTISLAGLPVALIGPWRRCWGVGTYRLYGLANYIMRGEKVQSNLPQLLVRYAPQLWGLLSLRRGWARQVDEGREQTAGALLLQPPQQKQKPLALPRTFSTVTTPFHPPRAGWSFGSSSSYKEFRALSTFRATATDD
jgi:hypothetical protein